MSEKYYQSAFSGAQIEEAIGRILNNGGSGGGASSWNDLTDKPFGDNEDGSIKQLDNKYLAILNKTGETDIIPAQDVAFTYVENSGYYNGSVDVPMVLTEGKTYYVEWNGKAVSCVAKTFDALILAGWALGNLSIFSSGEEDTGEDFLVLCVFDGDNTVFCTKETDATHTVRVYQAEYKVKDEYLPESSGGGSGTEPSGSGLPAVTTADNGKILQVVNGAWQVLAIADSAVKTYIDDYINSALEGEY